jgi:hypothetical protein
LYHTGKFGEAGCWMTENLAETAYAYSSPWSALQNTASFSNQAQWGNLLRLPLKPSNYAAYNTTNADTYGKSKLPAAGGFSGRLVGLINSTWFIYVLGLLE